MDVRHQLARTAALIGDPSRAAMLWSLLGGESRPASELALLAEVSPQTASNHLRLLLESGLLEVSATGRNRFYRLAGPAVAAALESLAVAASRKPPSDGAARHRAPELLFARTCYDHLAGELAVAILNQMRHKNYLREHTQGYLLTDAGRKFMRGLGIDVAAVRATRRRFAYACLDWSHRVPHLGGALGAALLQWLFQSGAVVRRKPGRAIRLTDRGHRLLHQHFSIRLTYGGAAIASQ